MRTEADWLERNGFNADGITYSIYGDNTYAIKDALKEQGCKYSPLFGWHCADPSTIDVPDGYKFCAFGYTDYMKWDDAMHQMVYFEGAQAKADRKIKEAQGPSLSEYMTGSIKDKFDNLTVVLKAKRGYSGRFGWTNIFTFAHGDNLLVWFTSTDPEIEEGIVYLLSGTIKGFEEYHGDKTTVVTRCKIQKVG